MLCAFFFVPSTILAPVYINLPVYSAGVTQEEGSNSKVCHLFRLFFLIKNTESASLPQISYLFFIIFYFFTGEEGGCGVCERRLGGGGAAVQGGR